MQAKERARKIHSNITDINVFVPELFTLLPESEYYKLKHMLEEAEKILAKYK